MCRKLIYSVSFVLVLGLVGSAMAALPAGWTSQDIGTTGGSASESGGMWTITADGWDIWENSDGFHYVYVPMSGDGQIVARVIDIGTGSDGWARGGVMIRETLEPDSKHVTITLTAGEGGGKELLCRPSTAGNSFSAYGGTSVSPPLWLRLVREGNSFTGYYSEDGANWVQQPDSTVIDGDLTTNPVKLEMAADVYIGLCFTSHIEGVMRTYTFDNVSLKLPVTALNPTPADGAIHPETWASLGWAPGHTAVSHDVYFSGNFDDVNDGTPEAFQGNQDSTFLVIGFPGFPFPDGLVPGTTYYWRVDEVEADSTTIHKGNVWSFLIPPKTAYDPNPADGAKFIDPDVELSWAEGFGAKLHTVYFGDNFDDVNNAAGGLPQGTTTYTPGPLKMAKTYYWRVDEFDVIDTYKGDIWSFTTEGGVRSPDPANGAVDVEHTPVLTWSPGVYAASHQVFFGADEDAVKNADTSSPEYKGSGNLGAESYEPEKLEWNSTYYWRIVEVNSVNPDSPWIGSVWNFTTANFLIVDDFESYNDLEPADPGSNRIFNTWLDGFDNPSNGSVIGYGNPPFAEQTIVHSGSQSMPFAYDNSFGYSEAILTLTSNRDWTVEDATTLAIWFRGILPAFTQSPEGVFAISAGGDDIWGTSDEGRFIYKQLSGDSSIVCQVRSVENTHEWARFGPMIRQRLDANSAHVYVMVSAGGHVEFAYRRTTDAETDGVFTEGFPTPHWVRLTRKGDTFTAEHSEDGVGWVPVGDDPTASSVTIGMGQDIFIGFAYTSHAGDVMGVAEFSDVTTTGSVTGTWQVADLGIETGSGNDPEPMYVAINDNAVVYHDNPNAALINDWTQWNIDLTRFADQGLNLANVNTIAIGFGDKKNPQPGGSGVVYFDDIRLNRPAP